MQITKKDKDFIRDYINFGLYHNLKINLILKEAFNKSKNLNDRMIYYIDLFSNLMRLTEIMEMVIYSIKKKGRGKGFWRTFIRYNANIDVAKKYLQEAESYKKQPIEYFHDVLLLNTNKFSEILKKKDVKIDATFWENNLHNIIQSLKLRIHHSARRSYNKIKHGFPIIGRKDKILIFIDVLGNNKLDVVSFTYKESEIGRLIDYTKFFTETIRSLLSLTLIS
ncbi:MAG: hypothetical protein DRP72_00360 [Candidatus Omnitrophota bacterium]|nr:MAG: hypothetical protein DRP72_00360 [Candidatus Omnitrophota bacterium]